MSIGEAQEQDLHIEDEPNSNLALWPIPKSWAWVTHEMVSLINPKLQFEIPGDLPVTFLPMANVAALSGVIDRSLTRQYREVKKGFTSFTDGDVIFAKITPCMENGKVAIVTGLTNSIGFGSTEFHVSRPTKFIISKYLFYFLNQERLRRDARRNMTGSAGQLRVPSEYFRSIKIPLPPVNEQRRIVAKIEELFSELDKSVECLRAAQEQLKVYRRALLKAAFEGRLVLIDRIEGNQTHADTEPDQVSLPQLSIPKQWKWVPLASLLDFGPRNGYSPKPVKYPTETKSLTLTATTSGKFDPTHFKYVNESIEPNSHLWLREGDLLMQRGNTLEYVGTAAIYRGPSDTFIYPDLMMKLRTTSALSVEYLWYYLNSPWAKRFLQSRATGTAGSMPKINKGTVESVPVPLCTRSEQDEIVQALHSKFSVCDAVDASIEEAFWKAFSLKQAILRSAFEGKLVSESPDDESVSLFIERLKAELHHTNGNGVASKISRKKKK